MALSAPWSSGDDLRVLSALELSMSEYMRTGIETCMNQMALSSTALVVFVQGELDRYETAKEVISTSDLTNPTGRILKKADVLEWEVVGGSVGATRELADAQSSIRRAFASCPYVPPETANDVTYLIRS